MVFILQFFLNIYYLVWVSLKIAFYNKYHWYSYSRGKKIGYLLFCVKNKYLTTLALLLWSSEECTYCSVKELIYMFYALFSHVARYGNVSYVTMLISICSVNHFYFIWHLSLFDLQFLLVCYRCLCKTFPYCVGTIYLNFSII